MENIPILEYDNTFNAVIQPTKDDYDFTLPDLCIAVFFKDVIDQIKNETTVV